METIKNLIWLFVLFYMFFMSMGSINSLLTVPDDWRELKAYYLLSNAKSAIFSGILVVIIYAYFSLLISFKSHDLTIIALTLSRVIEASI